MPSSRDNKQGANLELQDQLLLVRQCHPKEPTFQALVFGHLGPAQVMRLTSLPQGVSADMSLTAICMFSPLCSTYRLARITSYSLPATQLFCEETIHLYTVRT